MISDNEIDTLLQERADLCITVIIPMNRTAPERSKNDKKIRTALNKTKALIQKREISDKQKETLVQKLDALYLHFDSLHNEEGIGFYVSENISSMLKFPFQVIDKIKINQRFDARDLLYYQQQLIDYKVLSISKKHQRLLSGKGKELREVQNEDFPCDFNDDYEYAKPTRGTSFGSRTLKEFEHEKSLLQEIRLIDFLRSKEALIGKYIKANMPLLISGGNKEMADYLQVTAHQKNIIAKINGNYNFNGDLQLADHSWHAIREYLSKQGETLLLELKELIGKDLVAIGLEAVWKAANEGRGLELLLEKDLETSAYLYNDGFTLKEKKPVKSNLNYTTVKDAVEKTISCVRDKKGKIFFYENGTLQKFKGIALRLRYNNQPN